ncbi:hypothetical protein SY27_00990 [Flavobacterium sp. 316]|nr:hypothetical protein SY27_00990 [Flavobacterium sp. 316]
MLFIYFTVFCKGVFFVVLEFSILVTSSAKRIEKFYSILFHKKTRTDGVVVWSIIFSIIIQHNLRPFGCGAYVEVIQGLNILFIKIPKLMYSIIELVAIGMLTA